MNKISIRNDMRAIILSMIDDINYLMFGDLNIGSSYDVGETIEDKEIQMYEQMWERAWECPLCGGITKNVVLLDTGESCKKETEILSEYSIIDRDNLDHEIKMCFDSKDMFDAHMKTVHGIILEEDDIEGMWEDKTMTKHGAHYSDFRHGHKIQTYEKGKEHIRIHRQDANNEVFIEDQLIIVERKPIK